VGPQGASAHVGALHVQTLDLYVTRPDLIVGEQQHLATYGEPEEFGRAAAFLLSPPRPTSPAQ
jgi:hypothetical protein